MAVNHDPIFIGTILGKLTSFPAATSTTETDIFVGDVTDATRVDSIAFFTDDVLTPLMQLYLSDGTNDFSLSAVPGNRIVYSTGATLTYSATAKTITRSTGSFIDDGFMLNDIVYVSGAANQGNNLVAATLTTVTATVLTFANASGMVTNATGAIGGNISVGLYNTVNVLNHANFSAFVSTDACGNKFLNLPPNWKIRAKFVTALSTGKTAWVQVRGGKYA